MRNDRLPAENGGRALPVGIVIMLVLATGLAAFAVFVRKSKPSGGPEMEGSSPEATDVRASPVRIVRPPALAATDVDVAAKSSPVEPATRAPNMVARAEAERALLDRQQPEAFLNMLASTTQDSHSIRAVAEARRYLRDRTAAIRSMITAYVEAGGQYDFQQDLGRLKALDGAFREKIAGLGPSAAKFSEVPEIMANTALPVPSFARESVALLSPGDRVEVRDPAAVDIADQQPPAASEGAASN